MKKPRVTAVKLTDKAMKGLVGGRSVPDIPTASVPTAVPTAVSVPD